MHTSTKWLLGILIGVIVIVAFFFGWRYWLMTKPIVTPKPPVPTSSVISTADWKTYENKDLGFSFKYPKNYIVDINDSSGQIMINNQDSASDLTIYINHEFTYSATGKKIQLSSLDLDGLVTKLAETGNIFEPKKITFANLPAYEDIATGIKTQYEVIVKNSGNFFNFDASAENKANLSETQKAILASFRFTP